MKRRANTRREVIMKKDTKKAVIKRREAPRKAISMKTTRDIRARRDMNLTTHTMKSTAKREERRVDLSTVS